MPQRIQRKRIRGWRMPVGTVYVGRPGQWGNPFELGDFVLKGDADPNYRGPFKMLFVKTTAEHADSRFTKLKTGEQVMAWYRWYMSVSSKPLFALRGKNLACWCKVGAPCHGDVLLELANAPQEPETTSESE